jgi:hypothetical protein
MPQAAVCGSVQNKGDPIMLMMIEMHGTSVTVNKDNDVITFTEDEMHQLTKTYDSYFHEQDVISYLKELVAEERLPDEVLTNKKYIDAVLQEYEEYRDEDSCNFVTEALSAAVNNTDYKEYV